MQKATIPHLIDRLSLLLFYNAHLLIQSPIAWVRIGRSADSSTAYTVCLVNGKNTIILSTLGSILSINEVALLHMLRINILALELHEWVTAARRNFHPISDHCLNQ